MRKWIDIATITNKRGLEGGLVLHVNAGLSFLLGVSRKCYFAPPVLDFPREGTIEEVGGSSEAIVFFDSVNDASCAEALIGSHVLIDADGISLEENSDMDSKAVQSMRAQAFVGWQLNDVAFGQIGIVSAAEPRFEQVLLEVERPDGSTVLVPVADDLIVNVDSDLSVLTIKCPNGLLDI